jgi:hypothetical protein
MIGTPSMFFNNQLSLRKTVMMKHFVAAVLTLLGMSAVGQRTPAPARLRHAIAEQNRDAI